MVSIGTVDLIVPCLWFDEPLEVPTAFSIETFDCREVGILPKGTSINCSNWMLSMDLGVELEYTKEYVISTNTWIDEYGYGSTKKEALKDLLTSLLDLYESLCEQQQKADLADELVETLEKLDCLLVRGN